MRTTLPSGSEAHVGISHFRDDKGRRGTKAWLRVENVYGSPSDKNAEKR